MLRISFTTLACPNWSWENIVQTAVENKYDGIEVRGVKGEYDLTKAEPFIPENIGKTMADLKDKGLVISCLDTSCNFHDKSRLEEMLALGRSHIDLANTLGVSYIRVFGDHVPKGSDKQAIMRQIADSLKVLGDYARDRGVTVLLETHGDFTRSKDVLDMITMAEHPAVGVLWDVHHPYRTMGESMETSWHNLKDYIFVTHFKDSIVDGNGSTKYVLTGEGDVPLKECITILSESGRDIWVSFEWEKAWHPDIAEPETAIPHFIEVVRSYM